MIPLTTVLTTTFNVLGHLGRARTRIPATRGSSATIPQPVHLDSFIAPSDNHIIRTCGMVRHAPSISGVNHSTFQMSVNDITEDAIATRSRMTLARMHVGCVLKACVLHPDALYFFDKIKISRFFCKRTCVLKRYYRKDIFNVRTKSK